MAFVTPLVVTLLEVIFVFQICINAQAQTNNSNIIKMGSSLSLNFTSTASRSCWFSPSGLFAFGFYPQGNGFAVGIWMVTQPQTTVVWTAKRDDPPLSSDATLELTKRGLILKTNNTNDNIIPDQGQYNRGKYDRGGYNRGKYDRGGYKRPQCNCDKDSIISMTSSAALLDSGNFVLYSSGYSIIWESFNFPTDTILTGQNLSIGDKLVSSVSKTNHSSGKYHLIMQSFGTGNLVLYPANSSDTEQDTYMISETASYFYENLSLNCTGTLFLGNSHNNKTMILANGSSSSCSSLAGNKGENGSVIYRATLDPDGNFTLYSHHNNMFLMNSSRKEESLMNNITSSGSVEWSILENSCEVKGLCGFNSFCGLEGKKAVCYCYPGFAFINPKAKSLGCYRNFTIDACKTENDIGEPSLPRTSPYNITPMENIRWEDSDPYSEVGMKKEACHQSCLDECDCWAALYSSDKCRKYKLPLRYGKRDTSIPATAFFKVVPLGNHGIKPPVDVNPANVIPSRKSQILIILGSSLGSIAFLCCFLAISSFLLYKKRVYRYNKLLMENANSGLAQDFGLQAFSYDELERATEGFKEELGRGSFGAVYKGTLSYGGNIRAIAVRRLEKVVEEGIKEFRAEMFRAEMLTIGRTHHRNLVQMLGFCVEDSKRLLVYEFMSNGSLADLLFKATIRPSWKDRVRFILEVAKGVLYLHEECADHIIHCNLKPQNVLLDDNWTAKISDFGFARLLITPNQAKMSEALIEGRKGYSAPEWEKNAMISVKADVYSFGVVLLEIICCRRNVDLKVSKDEEMVLPSWAYNCFEAGELNKLVEGDQNVEARTLERMVKVGLWCTQDDPDLRPLMKNVILMLEGTMDVPPLPPQFATA